MRSMASPVGVARAFQSGGEIKERMKKSSIELVQGEDEKNTDPVELHSSYTSSKTAAHSGLITFLQGSFSLIVEK